MRPYYLELIAHARECGISFIFIDTDGNCYDNIEWFHKGMCVDGFVPFERRAGMDLAVARERYPGLLIIGGYNKYSMFSGDDEMLAEFERALPALKTGGIVPGCDHQTPPDVSLDQYKKYVRLLKEYAKKAAE